MVPSLHEPGVHAKLVLWGGSKEGTPLAGRDPAKGDSYTKYVRGMGLIASQQGADGYQYYLHNAHGDVVQLANASGNVTKNYSYDAFGVEKNPDGEDGNVWRYCGEYFDVETGTVYLRDRYYQPKTGRFTQEDPYWRMQSLLEHDPQGLNLYLYCVNNPILYKDLTGLDVYYFVSDYEFFYNDALQNKSDLESYYKEPVIIIRIKN